MKKQLIALSLISVATIAGCTNTPIVTETTDTGSDSNILTNNTNTMTTCPQSVKDYLDNADLKGNGQEVTKGNKITVDYIGRLKDGSIFDTSVESVAKACKKYNPNRDYATGLSFTVGEGQMIAGFDQGVQGMKIGQTKTITIPAAEAYGERDENKVMTVDKAKIPNGADIKAGMTVYSSNGQAFKVLKVEGTGVVLDMNHELAGKDLIFDITIKSIN